MLHGTWPIDDGVAFVAHVIMERRTRVLGEATNGAVSSSISGHA